MLFQLGELAEIRAGLTFRGRLSTYPEGSTFVIQPRTISQASAIDTHKLPGIQLPKGAEKHLIQKNDLIICPRAEGNEIQRVKSIDGEAVVSTPLLLLRANREKVLPAYVHWYLQYPEAIRQMQQFTEGSVIRKLGKKTLEKVSIPLPPLKKQQTIVDILALANKEQQLLSQLQKKRKQFIDATLTQIIAE